MHSLNMLEIEQVNGGSFQNAAAASALALAIGGATWGGAFGAVTVAAAFASAPLAVFAMGGLALYAGWEMLC
jgi:hypothetical protein